MLPEQEVRLVNHFFRKSNILQVFFGGYFYIVSLSIMTQVLIET